jgi:hypothetical protein
MPYPVMDDQVAEALNSNNPSSPSSLVSLPWDSAGAAGSRGMVGKGASASPGWSSRSPHVVQETHNRGLPGHCFSVPP